MPRKVDQSDAPDDKAAMARRLVTLEEELRAARQELAERVMNADDCRQIADHAGDAIFVHEPGGRFLYVNNTACERLGYSEAELLSMSPQDIDTPEFAARVLPHLKELSEEASILFESAHVRRDGKVLPVEISCRLITYGGGRAVLSVARDLSARKRLETALATARDELEATVAERTAALAATNTRLLAEIAERRRAEASLAASEARFRSILEQVPNLAVQGYDETRRVTFWNSASEELYGYTREEALGRRLEELIIPEAMREAVVAGVTAWLDEGRPVPAAEMVLKHKDGSDVPVYSSHVMLTGPDGRREMFCLDADLRQREAARRELAASEGRYRSIVEMASEGIWAMDRDFRTIYVNPAMAEMLGYEPGEMLGRLPDEFMFPEDSSAHLEQMATRRQGRSSRYERRLRKKDGSELWTLISARARQDANGGFEGALSMIADITAQKRAQAALEASEARYSELVDALPLSIMTFDAAGRVTYVNRWHLENFALGRHEPDYFKGLPFTELPGVASAGIEAQLVPLLSGREVNLREVYVPRTSGGCSVYQDIIGIPVPTGRDDGGILIRQDVTERKNAADSLAMAKESAEAANRSKSAFLANMSHDIRTPLHGLLGMLQLLEISQLDMEQVEYVQTALTSGRGLLSLINDILDLSRVDAGRLVLEDEPFDPREVVRTVLDSLSVQALADQIELVAEVDPDTPALVLGDARRLSQILYNLVGNAIKFTSYGRIAVSVCAPCREDGANTEHLLFSVADNGQGIPPDILPHIFEPFTSIENGTRRTGGTGLGLSIVKRLVGLMGGTIAVDSEFGVGTTVHFTITIRQPKVPEPGRNLAGEYDGLRSSLNVLVVDDDKLNRRLAERLLVSLGYIVTTAPDGPQALALMADDAFDVVLLDIQMPEMDGLEVCRRIRQADAGRSGPRPFVVAVTAHAMTGDRERFLSIGLDDYLAKPFSRAELAAILDRARTR